jgi:hypothetical protein
MSYLASLLFLGIVLSEVPAYLQSWLWMRQVGYLQVFWTLFTVQWGMFAIGFAFAFLFLWLNIRTALRDVLLSGRGSSTKQFGGPWGTAAASATDKRHGIAWLTLAEIGTSAVVAWAFALGFSSYWDTYLRYRYGGNYGLRDPLFGLDIGFYLFHLPFYELEQHLLGYLSFVTVMAVVAIYFTGASFRAAAGGYPSRSTGRAIRHVSALLLVLFAVVGWEFYLDRYELVYSTLGIVYGAGFAADHITRPVLSFMLGASIVYCALLGLNMVRPTIRAIVTGAIAYTSLYVLGLLFLPALFQHYYVQPNELALETPYLKRYISFTRKAYGLDKIAETSYPALGDLTPAALARNQDTIDNIRLWDDRPLLQTYQQTQAIRLYYDFYNVDTDRYHLADGYHQVMLSARELSRELPAKAQTWVNQRLQFTHGYDIVMSLVSKTAGDGIPRYVLDNIPARSSLGLKITRPEIYYGEAMRGYRIVGTKVREFDYPKGDDNVYTSYTGTGGIPLNSFWKRMLFAWTQHDVSILLTSYLEPQHSRIQLWRRVRDRVAQIAPFLRLDDDPYPVVSEGRLYWIADAYTASSYFPYSNPSSAIQQPDQPEDGFGINPAGRLILPPRMTDQIAPELHGQLNYVRNSVKAVVDMYDGTVRFYVMDPTDPVLAVYRHAFPGAFSNLDQLPAELKQHLRYPRDLFAVQTEQFRLFHMTDPQVFYNQEDLWQLPKENYEGETHYMRPHYVLMKLPGSTRLEYLLMTPFTPPGRGNMISWMAAKCDFPDYGHIMVFALPKERLIYGPNQVEAMIDQNTDISRQLSLWDQRGSHVIRGRQIVTPIENSFLYVVPMYLTSTGTRFPQLKRVIVAADGKVAMAPTLDAALADLFAPQQPTAATPQAAGNVEEDQAKSSLDRAREAFDRARKAFEQGNWGEFGKAMGALDQQLSTSAKSTAN